MEAVMHFALSHPSIFSTNDEMKPDKGKHVELIDPTYARRAAETISFKSIGFEPRRRIENADSNSMSIRDSFAYAQKAECRLRAREK